MIVGTVELVSDGNGLGSPGRTDITATKTRR
jgi:hypothetical protein